MNAKLLFSKKRTSVFLQKFIVFSWWRWRESNSRLNEVPRYNVYSFFRFDKRKSGTDTIAFQFDSKVFVNKIESSFISYLLWFVSKAIQEAELLLSGCKSMSTKLGSESH